MKKFVLLTLIVLIIFAFANLTFFPVKYEKENPTVIVKSEIENENGSEWETYNDDEFTFEYPAYFALKTRKINDEIRGLEYIQYILSNGSNSWVEIEKYDDPSILDANSSIDPENQEGKNLIKVSKSDINGNPTIIREYKNYQPIKKYLIFSPHIALVLSGFGSNGEILDEIAQSVIFLEQNISVEGRFCGGLAGLICPVGYYCEYDGDYPDSGGYCVSEIKDVIKEGWLPEKCIQKPDPGPCEGNFEGFYYDKENKACKNFNWGGCQGSSPFETMYQCVQTCLIKPTASQIGDASNEVDCINLGGTWGKWGMIGSTYCQIPAEDYDEDCTDGSQCLYGRCIAGQNNGIPGKCQKFKQVFGCISFIEDGKIGSALCID